MAGRSKGRGSGPAGKPEGRPSGAGRRSPEARGETAGRKGGPSRNRRPAVPPRDNGPARKPAPAPRPAGQPRGGAGHARSGAGQRIMLHRAFSKFGVGSRKQAVAWIIAGRVHVDGATVRDPFTWVDLQRNSVRLDGKLLSADRPHKYVLLHKPAGFVTTRRDERSRRTVYDLLPANLVPEGGKWIFPVGRLDRDTEGLLLLTDDGPLGEKLSGPEGGVEKTYRAWLDRPLLPEHRHRLEAGIDLEDGRTAPARVEVEGEGEGGYPVEITIHEGRNRQVRRMFAALDYRVRRLVRVRLGPLVLGGLAPGAWRHLGADEVERLRRA